MPSTRLYSVGTSTSVSSVDDTRPPITTMAIDGPASGQDLAAQLRVALGTVTGIVDRLVAQGLVERGEDPRDRRVRRVSLSPAGRELVDKILDAGTTRFRRLRAELEGFQQRMMTDQILYTPVKQGKKRKKKKG